ncbi:MAG: hypothetical protein OXG58_04090 [Gemmatimonadetes bacterium]|nr:hypothetical protein [Gemmatimonadota bacterium]MCY3943393.1 hypothetical protein [Gemmatimonadota bacterium]
MNHFVERTCTVVRGREEERGGEIESSRQGETESRPLEAFRKEAAYVLLGAPGAGKTEAFRREARWDGGRYITARDFLTLRPRPEWRGKTIYIDGLDEVRAGSADGRTPFDGIRAKLQELGCPRFRLSCREADWFGTNDRERLKAVAPDGVVQVLRLDPLPDQGILEILARNHAVPDPAAFVAMARKQGVEDLLLNPQNLRMLAEAVDEADPARQCRGQGGATEWPRTRAETFEMACRKLVSDDNPEHQIAWRGKADTESLLDAAGDLCALLLLAGKAGVTLPGAAPDTNHPRLDQIPGGNRQLLRHAVGTNLFAMPSEGRMAPAHRQIAEYLAARQLATRIAQGLPIRRVLALMTGFDGGIVSECRGLAAWLAALSQPARPEIIERDPIGVLLYGDAQPFGPEDKRLVLRALRGEIHRNPWLAPYSSAGPPLQPLVGPDLENDMREALTDPARDDAHQSFVRLICEAVREAVPRPGLADPLMAIVRDDSWPTHIRRTALKAYIRACQDDPGVSVTLRTLLDDVYTGTVTTRDDNLLGILLAELYPDNDARLGRLFEATLQDLKEEGGSLKAERGTRTARPPQGDTRFDELRNVFKDNESALHGNVCRADLLHTLAVAYFDGFSDVSGETPEERLRHLLGPDGDLLDAAMASLRGAIHRPDLPKWKEVSKLAAGGRTHYLAYPFMAGLQELSAAAGTGDCQLGDSQARLALAIHFALPRMGQADESRHPPRWLRDCVAREPRMVADVWSHCAATRLRCGNGFVPDTDQLAREPGYAHFARAASARLLKVFPVRCKAGQLPALARTLGAAMAHGGRTELVELIDSKIAYGSMNSGQRVHWLTAGLILHPGAYCDRLDSYVSGNVRRTQRLAEMIHEPSVLRALPDRMDATAVETLIRLLGPYTTGPPDTDRAYLVTWPIQADETIRSFIDRLAEDASDAAGQALDSLAKDDRLVKWRSRLLDSLHRQKSVRREAIFSHPALEQVAELLDNGRPTNAADLAALTMDKLRQLARRIRDGLTPDRREYWNVDRYYRAEKPRPENACRDALLSDLRGEVEALGIDATREGSYADDKRSDIRVAYGGFNVPIEIKRSCHDDWWSSIRTQLIAEYTRDPGTDGYGIYLVFWFGEADGCRPVPASGQRPRSPQELRRALLDSLSAAERRKISVCVIDVSNPRG